MTFASPPEPSHHSGSSSTIPGSLVPFGHSSYSLYTALQRLEKLLGPEWDHYQAAMYEFFIGRCTRQELDHLFSKWMEENSQFATLHNRFMLEMLHGASLENGSKLHIALHSVLKTKKRKRHADPYLNALYYARRDITASNAKSTVLTAKQQAENQHWQKVKNDVLALLPQDRKKLKSILREIQDPGYRPPSKPGVPIETRIARLPKIPITKDKLNEVFANDIQKGYNAELCCESRQLPDNESLKDRMIAIALEQGLVGGLEDGVTSILSIGLEYHLKNIITALSQNCSRTPKFDNGVRIDPDMSLSMDGNDDAMLSTSPKLAQSHGESKKRTLTCMDLGLFWTLQPYRLVERQPAQQRIELRLQEAYFDDELVMASNASKSASIEEGFTPLNGRSRTDYNPAFSAATTPTTTNTTMTTTTTTTIINNTTNDMDNTSITTEQIDLEIQALEKQRQDLAQMLDDILYGRD